MHADSHRSSGCICVHLRLVSCPGHFVIARHDVAHALRAVSRLISTLRPLSQPSRGVATSGDAARTSACATSARSLSQSPGQLTSWRGRKLWITHRYEGDARQLTFDEQFRDERPMWLSNETILFCRLDASSRASLWTITKDGLDPSRIADLAALPDKGNGYFGYIDWGEFFDVWAPHTLCSCRVR